MTFIGFLTEKKDENNFKKELKTMLEKFNIKAVVVAINEKNIENVKNIKFQTIIIDRNIEEKAIDKLKNILKVTKYIIVNADVIYMEKIENMNLTIITYGFASKCTITASSVDEEDMLFCLQRSIYNIYNKKIEPQETKSFTQIANKYLKMALITVEFLYKM